MPKNVIYCIYMQLWGELPFGNKEAISRTFVEAKFLYIFERCELVWNVFI